MIAINWRRSQTAIPRRQPQAHEIINSSSFHAYRQFLAICFSLVVEQQLTGAAVRRKTHSTLRLAATGTLRTPAGRPVVLVRKRNGQKTVARLATTNYSIINCLTINLMFASVFFMIICSPRQPWLVQSEKGLSNLSWEKCPAFSSSVRAFCKYGGRRAPSTWPGRNKVITFIYYHNYRRESAIITFSEFSIPGKTR